MLDTRSAEDDRFARLNQDRAGGTSSKPAADRDGAKFVGPAAVMSHVAIVNTRARRRQRRYAVNMNASVVGRQARDLSAAMALRRWVRRAKVGVALILVVWFARFSYVRITTPVAAARGAPSAPLERDIAAQLNHALRDWPPYAPPRNFSGRGFRGWLWSEILRGLQDDWAPESRPELAAIVAYVSSDAVGMASERAERVLAAAGTTVQDGNEPTWGDVDRRDQAACALTVRARWRRMENQDLAGALADLRLALRLLSITAARQEWDWPGFEIPMFELACLAQETPLPAELARGMIAFLREPPGTSLEAWARQMFGAADLQREFLDRYYSDDGHGDGWLVLSSINQTFMFSGRPPMRRSRAWNVLSPLFRGRRAMAARLGAWQACFEGLDDVADDVGMVRVRERSGPIRRDVFDGPLDELPGRCSDASIQRLYGDVSRRRACIVMLALAFYRGEHGAYPAVLSDLCPDYLDEIPLDATAHAAMIYEPTADGRYVLRSPAIGRTRHMSWWMSGFEWSQEHYSVSRNGAAPATRPF